MNFLIPGFSDVLDILLVAFILYGVILLFRKTSGFDILLILSFFIILYFISAYFKLQMIMAILKGFQNFWILALVIIFQPEIRNGISKASQTRNLFGVFFKSQKRISFNPILDAVTIFSERHIGALIVFERTQLLDEFIAFGEILDSALSSKLILTVFNTQTILHDGAVIIRNGRLYAAKVVLPLSKNIEHSKVFGTRHLAALGITEITDAYCVVVSEQTGRISFASKGEIITNLSIEELLQLLTDEIKK